MNKHVIEVPELGIQILDKVGIKLEIFLFEGLRKLCE